nr:PREDICTED: TP53-target gene 5 protein [Latimeria chalumnae]|eukprot:XP_014342258.1 PREDICTED: TP53-target gene 5 protein [Latimeria chalumnae]
MKNRKRQKKLRRSLRNKPQEVIIHRVQSGRVKTGKRRVQKEAWAQEKKTQLKIVLRQLILLRVLRGTDRRIQRLQNLARQCWRMLLQKVNEFFSKGPVRKSIPPPPPHQQVKEEKIKSTFCQGEPFWFKDLPHSLHLPAPKVLCRPSKLRWMKPCCTRSCEENLEHPVTQRYYNL